MKHSCERTESCPECRLLREILPYVLHGYDDFDVRRKPAWVSEVRALLGPDRAKFQNEGDCMTALDELASHVRTLEGDKTQFGYLKLLGTSMLKVLRALNTRQQKIENRLQKLEESHEGAHGLAGTE